MQASCYFCDSCLEMYVLYLCLPEEKNKTKKQVAGHPIGCPVRTDTQKLCDSNQSLKSSGSEVPSGSLITADL